MRNFKKIFTVLFSSFFVFLIFSGFLFNEAHACSCIASDSPKKEMERFDVVFSGKVLSIEEIHPNEPMFSSIDPLLVTIDVDRIWKGLEKRNSTITVSTPASSASCGFYFEKNIEYVVYANQYAEEDHLQVSLCSRTNTVENAVEDLAELGEGFSFFSDSSTIPPPLKQQKMILENHEIECKSHLNLIFKESNGNPACVKPASVEKLIQRGWGTMPNTE